MVIVTGKKPHGAGEGPLRDRERSERGSVLAHQRQDDAALAALEALDDDLAGAAVGQLQGEGLADRVLGAAAGAVRGAEVTGPRRHSTLAGRLGEEGGGAGSPAAVGG